MLPALPHFLTLLHCIRQWFNKRRLVKPWTTSMLMVPYTPWTWVWLSSVRWVQVESGYLEHAHLWEWLQLSLPWSHTLQNLLLSTDCQHLGDPASLTGTDRAAWPSLIQKPEEPGKGIRPLECLPIFPASWQENTCVAKLLFKEMLYCCN